MAEGFTSTLNVVTVELQSWTRLTSLTVIDTRRKRSVLVRTFYSPEVLSEFFLMAENFHAELHAFIV